MIVFPLAEPDIVALETLCDNLSHDLFTLTEIFRGQGVSVALTDRLAGAELALHPAIDMIKRRAGLPPA